METTELTGLSITSNSTGESLEYGPTLTPFHIFVMIFTTLTILLILLLNPLMLVTLWRVTSIQPTTKIFMASLILSDLCNGTLWMPTLSELFAGTWLLGDFLCASNGVTAYIFSALSIYSLLLLSVNRYISILHPLRYPSMMTVLRSKILVCSTWGTIIIITTVTYASVDPSTVLQIGNSTYMYQLCLTKTLKWRVYLSVILTVLPLVTIFILYAHINLIARYQARRIAAENQAGNGQGGQTINTRSTTTIIIITGTVFITWIPVTIRKAVVEQNHSVTYDSDSYIVIMFTQALVLSNGWLNVIIYFLRNRDLRQALRSLLSDMWQSLNQRILH